MTKYFLLLIFVMTAGTHKAGAQQKLTIHGKVVDTAGQMITGASLTFQKSGAFGINTGRGFAITTSHLPDTLWITAVGYESRTVYVQNANGEITIVLKQNPGQLENVVVNTGYQSIPKERVTGSFYAINNQLLNERTEPDVLDRLDGITSSFLMDKRDPNVPNYQIRGLSTLNQEANLPLIVLDNFSYEGDIHSINPNDVESVTVLKDAAAASIWGARAGNGVIVITTKKGSFNRPLHISLNSNITFDAKPDLFTARQMPVPEFIGLEKYLFAQGNYDWQFDDTYGSPLPQVPEILNQLRNGEISREEADQKIQLLAGNDVRSDMEKYLYRSQLQQQYAINMTGGSRTINYLFSAGYDKNLSTLKGNDDQRFTIRSAATIHIADKWQFSSGVTLTHSLQHFNSPGGYGSYNFPSAHISPYSRLINPDGSPAAVDILHRGLYTDTAGNGQLLDWKYRPLQELENNDHTATLSDMLLNLGTTYRFTPWLNADIRYQYQSGRNDDIQYHNLASYYTRDLINIFTQLTPSGPVYALPKGGILSKTLGNTTTQSVRGQINVNRYWQRSEFNAIAGGEIRDIQHKATTIVFYGYDEHTLSFSSVDYVTRFPTYNGTYGNMNINEGTYLSDKTNRFVSLYANAAYTLFSRYTLSGSVRKDASNLFGVSANQKWVPLWSAGAMWQVNKESFYKAQWLPQLKFRITYGVSGNLNASVSALTTISYISADRTVLNIPSAYIASPPNPDLHWEKVKTFNTGIDFALKNNRIAGSVDYYIKNSIDLINAAQTDPVIGFRRLTRNSATILAHGVDVVINTINLNGRVKWKSLLLFNYINYKVTKNLDPPSTMGLATDGTYIFPVEGYNPYVIVSFKWAGLDPETGDPQGYVDGKLSKDYRAISNNPLDQQVVSGSALPSRFGTFRNTLEWKQFSLAFNIIYKLGYYFRKPAISYSDLFYNSGSNYPDFSRRWKKPGDEEKTNVPSMIYPADYSRDYFYQRSSINVEKADHIRLTDMYAAYALKTRASRTIRSLQFYTYIRNLNILLWKANKSGIDPEILYGVKPSVSFTVGLKASF